MMLSEFKISGKEKGVYKIRRDVKKTYITEPDGSLHVFNYELSMNEVLDKIKKYEVKP